MHVVYLDNQATTPIDPRILEAMLPFMKEYFGNPASKNHILGWQAEEAVEIAREHVAKLIKAESDEVIFTSGATESINLSIQGLFNKRIKNGDHIIISNIEHSAVIDTVNHLMKNGVEVSFAKVNKQGILEIGEFEKHLRKNTKFCSMIHANNEIGTIQPIKEIGKICRNNEIILHVDAAQSLGKKRIDVNKMNIDLLSISGHKIYGPKGVGALFIRRKNPRIELNPLIFGGGHEKGVRPGTSAVHNIVGFGHACKIYHEDDNDENIVILTLRERLLEGLKNIFPKIKVNGSLHKRLEGNLNITFPKYSAEKIMMKMTAIACSTGAACTSYLPTTSHVLLALGLNKEQINNTIRFGIGRFNTKEEINFVIELFDKKFQRSKNANIK